jgi:ferrochelatase
MTQRAAARRACGRLHAGSAMTATMPRSNHYTGVAGHSDGVTRSARSGWRAAGEPGYADRAHGQSGASVSGRVSRRSARHRLPRWLWWLILHGVILRVRPARSAHAYAKIWTDQGSPLRFGSEALAAGLQTELDPAASECPIRVALAMRYGEPSVARTIERLQREGVRKLLVLPLYPQYSATSSGSVIDAVPDTSRRCAGRRSCASSTITTTIPGISRRWRKHRSAGGNQWPRRQIAAVVPRHSRTLRACRRSVFLPVPRHRATAARTTGPDRRQLVISFQSRVGRERWLQPYTDPPCASWRPKA